MTDVSAHNLGLPDSYRDGYVVGVDFGTLSARALVVRVADGSPAGTAIYGYPHQVMDAELAATGEPLPPDWALQDPGDYVEALRHTAPRCASSTASAGTSTPT
jgi:L-ribulokinase